MIRKTQNKILKTVLIRILRVYAARLARFDGKGPTRQVGITQIAEHT